MPKRRSRDRDVHNVSIYFSGNFQLRLATDPDPSTEHRGRAGWTFAHTAEPDLDRIIRFNEPVAPRRCAARVGVAVKRVTIDGAERADAIVGQRFDLGPRSFFDGSVAGPGTEPIANFEVHIGTPSDYLAGESVTPPGGMGVQSLVPPTAFAPGGSAAVAFEGWLDARLGCLAGLSLVSGSDQDKNRNERIEKARALAPPAFSIRMQALWFSVFYVGKVDKNLVLKPKDSEVIKRLQDGGVSEMKFDATFSSFDADGLVGVVNGALAASWS